MNDYVIFGHVYIPGFMALVISGLVMLFTIKHAFGGLLRRGDIINPSLSELCLVIIVIGQLILLQVS